MAAGLTEEIELKLDLTPEGADALEAVGIFAGEPRIIPQHATYFDTPDQALAGAGISLRVRHEDGRWIQTIKLSPSAAAGVFIRPEWQRDLVDETPVIDASTPIPALIGDDAPAIGPVFEIANLRHLWLVDGIEIAIDRGRAIAGERESPFCEVELELKRGGDPAALFAIARRIDAISPVHLGVLSKAERGYRLLGPLPGAARAEPVALADDMDAAQAFQAVAHACLRHFRLNVPLILDPGDPEALHQARVAIRRLRSAMVLWRPLLTGEEAARLNGELRWLGLELGRARDLDVLGQRAAGGPLAAQLATEREAAYAAACTTLESDRGRAALIDVAEWIVAGEWQSDCATGEWREMPVRQFADQTLDRWRRKVKRGGRDFAHLSDKSRHDLRKAAKKLRYAAEFFAPLYARKRERRRLARYLATLETLQDRLGQLNDLVATPVLLGEFGLAEEPGAADLMSAGRKAELIDAAAEAHDALADVKAFWR